MSRRPIRIAATAALPAILVLTVTPPAGAYSLLTEDGWCPSGIAWGWDQDLTFNLANIGLQSFEFFAGVAAVADRIDTVGGQTFDYNDPYLTSFASYVSFGSGNTNISGTNDVGLADLSALGPPGGMGPTEVAVPLCVILEGDVLLDDSDNNWHFSVPEIYGDLYFDADYTVTDALGVNGNYARHVLLHELGHTLGLAHNDHGFSAMNYNIRPWSNRIDEKMMEFLPDDREALRRLYPGTGTEKDVAVLTTWFDANDISSSGAARQKKLCAPSKGAGGYSPSKFDPTCGVRLTGADGSTNVCPGDKIYTRYAVANYGTVDMTMDEELWFSKNDWLNRTAGVDKKSATGYASLTVLANQSQRKGKSFIVPSGLDWDTDYYPILFLDTGSELANEESEQNNWIPLRATVHVKRQSACP